MIPRTLLQKKIELVLDTGKQALVFSTGEWQEMISLSLMFLISRKQNELQEKHPDVPMASKSRSVYPVGGHFCVV
jgi:hypothetical protein